MKDYPRWGAVPGMTAAVIIMLSMSAQSQTAAPSPSPVAGQTNDQNSEVNPSNPQTSGGQLEQVTVTGYLIPRVGEGPQPVTTLNQDFIQKQAYQTVNDVLNNYPGGLSGRPLTIRARELIRDIHTHTRGKIPIIGVGGVATAEDAWLHIRAGASLVELYTALIYEGPAVVEKINSGLSDLLRRNGFRSIGEAVGIDR